MVCPVCKTEYPEGSRFCAKDGSPLLGACPNCGRGNPGDARFCVNCGAELHSVAPDAGLEAELDPSDLEASFMDRRTVTILFADVVGYTSLAEITDAEDLQEIMAGTFSVLHHEVEAREGSVEKYIGDAIMATFGAPPAHENDPARAVECALRMLEAVRARAEKLGIPLQIRIGINTGKAVSGEVRPGEPIGIMGDAVNVAARLQQASAPGEILVSAAVWSQVRDDFAADRVGPIEVKGRQQPVEAYRILGTAPASRRRITPFVGRQKELTLLELLWSQSLTTGSAFVVSIIGDPGVGKSRLVSEVPPREGALDVRVRCESDRAYGPFLDLFEQILGGTPNDPIDLLHRTRELGVEDEVAVLVGTLLGLSGAPPVLAMADDQQKRQVFSGVWMFLTTILRDRPGLIVFDDLHWADRSSLELLSFLLERLGGLPLCMILSYRSGFDPMSRIVLRAGKIEVQLSLLTDEESVDLAMGYLGVRALPDRLERALVTRAEGNPFFIEELLEMLRELGLLVVADGQASLAGSDNTEVPDTVQGVILARIDRLKWDSRIVLQHAAVLGRVFTQDLLQSVVSDRDVVPPLDELSRAQLLIAQDAGVWSFKHAIIQEVTYETLLIRQRRSCTAGWPRPWRTASAASPAGSRPWPSTTPWRTFPRRPGRTPWTRRTRPESGWASRRPARTTTAPWGCGATPTPTGGPGC